MKNFLHVQSHCRSRQSFNIAVSSAIFLRVQKVARNSHARSEWTYSLKEFLCEVVAMSARDVFTLRTRPHDAPHGS